MTIKTKRWNDPVEKADGFRLLVCRYRPRGLRKQDETWDAWWPALGPSRELHADIYGKHGEPISWSIFRRRYLAEMKREVKLLDELVKLARSRTVTLLCSSACTNAKRCHRSLLKELVEARAKLRNRMSGPSNEPREAPA